MKENDPYPTPTNKELQITGIIAHRWMRYFQFCNQFVNLGSIESMRLLRISLKAMGITIWQPDNNMLQLLNN
jgi:hypothetical protein